MLVPKRAKYRKQFRGSLAGTSSGGTFLSFGQFGLKALGRGWVSSRQIEAGRRVLTRYTQKGGRVWIRIFPHKPISDKPAEVRMGGGKGEVVDYVAVVKPGRILFEMGGISAEMAKKALNSAAAKLSVQSKFIEK